MKKTLLGLSCYHITWAHERTFKGNCISCTLLRNKG